MSDQVNDLPFPEAGDDSVYIPLVFKANETYTKDALTKEATEVMQGILDEGIKDPLSLYTRLKVVSEYVNNCMDYIKESAIDELDKHGKDGAKLFGIPVIKKETAKKMSYEHNDKWCALDDSIQALTAERKQIEAQMKGAIGTAGLIDDETGEIIEPAKVINEGKTTIAVSIPKK
jgi:hypothetical protein